MVAIRLGVIALVLVLAASGHFEDNLSEFRRIKLDKADATESGFELVYDMRDAQSTDLIGRLELSREQHLTASRADGEHTGACHFIGRIANVPGSLASLSNCDGHPLQASIHYRGRTMHVAAAKSNADGAADGEFTLHDARAEHLENLSHEESSLVVALALRSGELDLYTPATADRPAVCTLPSIAGMWAALSRREQENAQDTIHQGLLDLDTSDLEDSDVDADAFFGGRENRKSYSTDQGMDNYACFPLETLDDTDDGGSATFAAVQKTACAAPAISADQTVMSNPTGIKYIELKVHMDQASFESTGKTEKSATEFAESLIHKANFYWEINDKKIGTKLRFTLLSVEIWKSNPSFIVDMKAPNIEEEAKKKFPGDPMMQQMYLKANGRQDPMKWLNGYTDFVAKQGGRGKYDHTVLLTGVEIPGATGAAWHGTMCSKDSSTSYTSLQYMSGFAANMAALTLVHEMSHSIGVKHDEQLGMIMGENPVYPGTANPKFSDASIAQFRELLPEVKCIQDLSTHASCIAAGGQCLARRGCGVKMTDPKLACGGTLTCCLPKGKTPPNLSAAQKAALEKMSTKELAAELEKKGIDGVGSIHDLSSLAALTKISSADEYHRILSKAGGRLVCVYFTATWCGPCRRIGPVFDKMSNEFGPEGVIFLKVDIDEHQDLAAVARVSGVPTFQFWKFGDKVAEFSGADPGQLRQLVVGWK